MEAAELERVVERARASLFHIDVFYTESDDDRRRIKDLTEALNLLTALRSPADVDLSEALKGYVGIASGPCNEGWRTVVFFNDPEKAHALDSLLHNAALSSGESQ